MRRAGKGREKWGPTHHEARKNRRKVLKSGQLVKSSFSFQIMNIF